LKKNQKLIIQVTKADISAQATAVLVNQQQVMPAFSEAPAAGKTVNIMPS
jgi:hypothetical protein